MDMIGSIIRKKPRIFLTTSIVYLVVVGVLTYIWSPEWAALWYLLGGLLGVYFLDAAEQFFALSPSPFRTVQFLALYAVVSFFVVTSGGSAFASGLVLSLYLQLVLWQFGEWRVNHNLQTWYRLFPGTVDFNMQKIVFIVSVCVFMIESILFIRS